MTKSKHTKQNTNTSVLEAIEIESLFSILAQSDPDPKTELVYFDSFTLLIAVLLSAQATDISVNKATAGLFNLARNPNDMLDLGVERIMENIKSIGLYKTKAANIVKLCHILLEEHDGKVPDKRDLLEKLPGVGRKTANVVLNEAFGQPTIAVDTHIFRVSNRTGLAQGKNPAQVEGLLEKVVPDQYKKSAHHWLILHGRYICKARKPACDLCSIASICRFEGKQNYQQDAC